jgi:hypothetical protein
MNLKRFDPDNPLNQKQYSPEKIAQLKRMKEKQEGGQRWKKQQPCYELTGLSTIAKLERI